MDLYGSQIFVSIHSGEYAVYHGWDWTKDEQSLPNREAVHSKVLFQIFN